MGLPTLAHSLSKEDPSSALAGTEVSPGHPASGLVRLPSFGPVPQSLEDGGIRFHEGYFAGPMAMIVSPAPDHGVELRYQIGRRRLLVGLHNVPALLQECLDILPGRFDEEFPCRERYSNTGKKIACHAEYVSGLLQATYSFIVRSTMVRLFETTLPCRVSRAM